MYAAELELVRRSQRLQALPEYTLNERFESPEEGVKELSHNDSHKELSQNDSHKELSHKDSHKELSHNDSHSPTTETIHTARYVKSYPHSRSSLVDSDSSKGKTNKNYWRTSLGISLCVLGGIVIAIGIFLILKEQGGIDSHGGPSFLFALGIILTFIGFMFLIQGVYFICAPDDWIRVNRGKVENVIIVNT